MNNKQEWKWNKTDYPEKNGLKVFSCFACGGGSTMGYKLAGFDVIGANDIDKQMADIYKKNHNPKHYFLEDIRDFVKRDDLPKELYNLDILDGSPPCSSFSMCGNREKNWGEEKQFREGQSKQILDDLFFYYLELADKLRPKIVIAENVKGMLIGNAKKYLDEISDKFIAIGYEPQLFLINSSSCGVAQRRERIIFVARRKDLKLPKLKLDFKEKPITFGDIRTDKGITKELIKTSKTFNFWNNRIKSDRGFSPICDRLFGKKSWFNWVLIHDNLTPNTLPAGANFILFDKPKHVYTNDMISIQTFPQDYDFIKNKSYNFIVYVLGMSVPPLMYKKIAGEIKTQIFDKIK